MHEQYILQPTESSPGTGNSSPQRKRMAEWHANTRAVGNMGVFMQEEINFPAEDF